MTHLEQAEAFIRAAQEDCRGRFYVQALINHEAALAAISAHRDNEEQQAHNDSLRQQLAQDDHG